MDIIEINLVAFCSEPLLFLIKLCYVLNQTYSLIRFGYEFESEKSFSIYVLMQNKFLLKNY